MEVLDVVLNGVSTYVLVMEKNGALFAADLF